MSEEQRITKVEKGKDPRRVEAGKRLAAISRAAKEKRARQRSEAEQQHTEHTCREEPEPTEEACNEGYSMITVLTGVGVLTGLVCLYFTYRQDQRTQTTVEPRQLPTEVSKQQSTSSSGSKLRSLDD